jgi:tetratricopeptide (TPR) repeat protein
MCPYRLQIVIFILTVNSLALANTLRCEELFLGNHQSDENRFQLTSDLLKILKEQNDLKNWDGVLQTANKILAIDPRNTLASAKKSKALLEMSRYEEFFESLKDRLQNSSEPIVKLDIAQEIFGKLTQRIERVLLIEPDNIIFLRFKAFVFYKTKKYADFLIITNKILELRPKDYSLFDQRSKAMKKLRLYAELSHEIDRTLKIAPSYSPAIFAKVLELIKLGRVYEAEKWLNQSHDSTFKEYLKARILIILKQHQAAVDTLVVLPFAIHIKWLLAQAYFLKGDIRNARLTLIDVIQKSKSLHVGAIAALVKIQELGEGSEELDIFLSNLLATIPRRHLNQFYKLKDGDVWDYEPNSDANQISINNPFWNGLNNYPINKQTFNSTR